METLTFKTPDIDKIKTVNLRVYHRIVKIACAERRSNEVVVRQFDKGRELINTINHVMRVKRWKSALADYTGKNSGEKKAVKKKIILSQKLKAVVQLFLCRSIRAAVSKIGITIVKINLW